MWQSVERGFVGYTVPFEGCVSVLYPDVKGLLTIAIGCLVDPLGAALDIPLLIADGTPASRQLIGAEWRMMKAAYLAGTVKNWIQAKKIATLHLSPEGISQVVGNRLHQMDAAMAKRFSNWETMPANAQLSILSLCWACGVFFNFPKLEASVRAEDWATAATECEIGHAGNPGVIPRSKAQRLLFENAVMAVSSGADLSLLYYPDPPLPLAASEHGAAL